MTKRQRKAQRDARKAHAMRIDAIDHESFDRAWKESFSRSERSVASAVGDQLRNREILITRECRIERADSDDGTVELSFSSENPVRDAWSSSPTVILHEPGAADFSRLDSVLFNHDADQVIGAVISKTIDEKSRKARAVIRFDDDEDSQRIAAKVRSGSIKGVSVGFVVTKAQRIGEGETWKSASGRTWKGPLNVATKWSPLELSLTPVPADRTVGTDRNLSSEGSLPMKMNAQLRALLEKRGLSTEATEEEAWAFLNDHPEYLGERAEDPKPKPAADPAPTPASTNEPIDVRAIALAERQRIEGIRSIAADAEIGADRVEEWISNGTSVEAARAAAWEVFRARRRPVDAATKPSIETGEGSAERFLRDAEYALGFHAGLRGVERPKGCEMNDISLPQLYRECCVIAKVPNARYTAIEDLFDSTWNRRSFGHVQDDFANILENIASHTLQGAFEESPVTYTEITGRDNLRDFKTVSRAKFGEAANFEELPELMKVNDQTIGDAKEQYQLATFATKFSCSRQTIISDDLGALNRIPRLIGQSAARSMNHNTWDHIIQASGVGPTMAEDSKALFATDHTSGANYVTGATALSTATLGAGRKLIRLQKGLNARGALNLTPSILVVPATIEQTADELINGTYLPTAATTAMTQRNRNLRVIVEPYLDSAATNGTTAWYLFVDPSQLECIVVARLGGQTAPIVMRDVGTDVLGVAWIAYYDFGVKAVEHRGVFRHKGA